MLWNTCTTAVHYVRRCFYTVLFVIAKRILTTTMTVLIGHSFHFEEVITPDGRRVLRTVQSGRKEKRAKTKKGSASPNVSIDGQAHARGGDLAGRPAEGQEKVGRWGGVATPQGRRLIGV